MNNNTQYRTTSPAVFPVLFVQNSMFSVPPCEMNSMLAPLCGVGRSFLEKLDSIGVRGDQSPRPQSYPNCSAGQRIYDPLDSHCYFSCVYPRMKRSSGVRGDQSPPTCGAIRTNLQIILPESRHKTGHGAEIDLANIPLAFKFALVMMLLSTVTK